VSSIRFFDTIAFASVFFAILDTADAHPVNTKINPIIMVRFIPLN
jgi:hypothetical protein